MPSFDINNFRLIEPARSYTWQVQFPTAPKPFDIFFPASEVSFGIAPLESFSQEIFLDTLKVPLKGTTKAMSITYFDGENLPLEDYFEAWMKGILNDGEYVQTLDLAAREVRIRMENSRGDIIKQRILQVYPEGVLAFKGDNEPALTSNTMEFVIVG